MVGACMEESWRKQIDKREETSTTKLYILRLRLVLRMIILLRKWIVLLIMEEEKIKKLGVKAYIYSNTWNNHSLGHKMNFRGVLAIPQFKE
jgi:hypothetical protein